MVSINLIDRQRCDERLERPAGSEMFRPEDEYPNFPVLPRQLFRAKSLDETFACTYAERDPRHLAIVGNTAVTVMFGPSQILIAAARGLN